jgi:hypothetical protein
MDENQQLKTTINESVRVGGEKIDRPKLPTSNPDGTPIIYRVKVTGYRKKAGRPDDQGKETVYYSWSFEILEGEYTGQKVYGATNDQARRAYTTKKPLKLLQLIIAVNNGKEPTEGEVWNLNDILGKTLRVELEDKTGSDEDYQIVYRYYPDKV